MFNVSWLYSLLFYYVGNDEITLLGFWWSICRVVYRPLFLSWQVFRNSLHPPDYQSRLEIVNANSKLSLNRTGTSMSKSGTMQVSTSPYLMLQIKWLSIVRWIINVNASYSKKTSPSIQFIFFWYQKNIPNVKWLNMLWIHTFEFKTVWWLFHYYDNFLLKKLYKIRYFWRMFVTKH